MYCLVLIIRCDFFLQTTTFIFESIIFHLVLLTLVGLIIEMNQVYVTFLVRSALDT